MFERNTYKFEYIILRGINSSAISRILFGRKLRYFNLPVLDTSQNKLINEIAVNNNVREIDRNLNILKEAYHKASFFDEVFPIIKEI